MGDEAAPATRGKGDDRPAVYRDAGQGGWVYRVSSLGRCEVALRYARAGKEGAPIAQGLQKAMDVSGGFEGAVIDAFSTEYQVVVSEQQAVGMVEVAMGVWIRGSVDGIGSPLDLGGDPVGARGLVEVKVFGEAYLKKWLAEGLGGFPEYEHQFHTYCKLMGLKGGWMVVASKVPVGEDSWALETKSKDDPRVKLWVKWVGYSPTVWAQARAKVLRTESWYQAWRLRTVGFEEERCTGEWGCRYWKLHQDTTEVTIEPQLVAQLTKATEMESSGKQLVDKAKEIRAQVGKSLLGEGQESIVVSDLNGATRYKLTLVQGSSTRTDLEQMEKDGIDVKAYQSTKANKPWVKATRQKGTESARED